MKIHPENISFAVFEMLQLSLPVWWVATRSHKVLVVWVAYLWFLYGFMILFLIIRAVAIKAKSKLASEFTHSRNQLYWPREIFVQLQALIVAYILVKYALYPLTGTLVLVTTWAVLYEAFFNPGVKGK